MIVTIRGTISATVTFKVVNGKWDDDSASDKIVTLTGYEDDTLKLTAAQIPAVGSKPGSNYKAGSWNVTPSTDTAITAATTYIYTYAQKEEEKEEGKEGEIETETDVEKDVPKTTVTGLTSDVAKEMLTEEEKKAVESGDKLTVSLEITNITNSVPEKDKEKTGEAAKAASPRAKVGMYLDLSFYKKVGNRQRRKVSSLNGKEFQISVDVPDRLKAPSGVVRTFYLIRIHNGKATILATTKKTRITFATGEFSTYALAYSDVKKTEKKPEKTSTGGYSSYSGGASVAAASGGSYSASSGGGGGSSSYDDGNTL